MKVMSLNIDCNIILTSSLMKSDLWPLRLLLLLPSVQTEGRAELPQHVHVQVNSAEREKNADGREPDQNPKNLRAEVERSQTAERQTEHRVL